MRSDVVGCYTCQVKAVLANEGCLSAILEVERPLGYALITLWRLFSRWVGNGGTMLLDFGKIHRRRYLIVSPSRPWDSKLIDEYLLSQHSKLVTIIQSFVNDWRVKFDWVSQNRQIAFLNGITSVGNNKRNTGTVKITALWHFTPLLVCIRRRPLPLWCCSTFGVVV